MNSTLPVRVPLRHPSGGTSATGRLVERIHQANRLAKIALGSSKARLYRIKYEGVLLYAELYPERVYLTGIKRLADGKSLLNVAGFGLGRLHLLVDDPRAILDRVQLANRLQEQDLEIPA